MVTSKPRRVLNCADGGKGYYFHFVSSINLLLVAACTASYSVFITIPQYWLKLWTDSKANDTTFYITGLVIISFISWLSTSGTMWCVFLQPVSHGRALTSPKGCPSSPGASIRDSPSWTPFAHCDMVCYRPSLSCNIKVTKSYRQCTLIILLKNR
jgi:hypothetical protein